MTRFPDKAYFAPWNGTVPIDDSSGEQVRHRLSRAGNRQINRVLHIMAVVQLRNPTEGRAYDRKVAAGKTPMEAMRSLKRRLSDIVYHQMILNAQAVGTGPGGHVGAVTGSSAAGLHPSAGTSEKSAQAYRPQLWLGVNNRGPVTANGIYQMIVRRGRQSGVAVHPHRFRHHFSHTWLDRGGAEGNLMELNGWLQG